MILKGDAQHYNRKRVTLWGGSGVEVIGPFKAAPRESPARVSPPSLGPGAVAGWGWGGVGLLTRN